MHILVIPSWYPVPESPIGGSFFREQVQALKRAGLQMGVIYPHLRSLRLLGKRLTGWPQGIRCEDDAGVPTYRHETWFWSPGLHKRFHATWVHMGKRLFERYTATFGQPDLIHAHAAIHGGVLAAHLSATYKIPFVLTEHSSAYALGWYREWHLPLVAQVLAQARARLMVSPTLGKRLEELFGPVATPWVWAPNMVDPAFTIKAPPAPPAASRPFTFLTVGLLEENKRQDHLLRAFAERFRQKPKVQLQLAGEGSCRTQLETVARTLGVAEQVHFLGRLDRSAVVTAMQQADAFVLSSQYETFGIVLIEALACGKPVVATACGGPESIVDEQNGLLVPVNDLTALGDALERMVTNAPSYDPVQLRHACLQRFGEQAVVAQVQRIYQQVLAAS